jgi:anti-sigma regulatory factor (Ser/Thr protein kinase)
MRVYFACPSGIEQAIMTENCGTFPSTYASVSRARHSIVQYAASRGLSGESLNDLESAVGEALANAAEHGHSESGTIAVTASVTDGLLVIEIKDSGLGFAHAESRVQPPHVLGESLRGFGIFIMRELMDVVEYSERGSCLRLMKRLSPAQADRWEEA